MEDVLPSAGAEEATVQWFLRLPSGGADVSHHDDP